MWYVAAVVLVSTTGLSPLTVTVSCTVEISSCWLICAVKPSVSRTVSRTTVLNPGSSNLTVYVPMGSRGKL